MLIFFPIRSFSLKCSIHKDNFPAKKDFYTNNMQVGSYNPLYLVPTCIVPVQYVMMSLLICVCQHSQRDVQVPTACNLQLVLVGTYTYLYKILWQIVLCRQVPTKYQATKPTKSISHLLIILCRFSLNSIIPLFILGHILHSQPQHKITQ